KSRNSGSSVDPGLPKIVVRPRSRSSPTTASRTVGITGRSRRLRTALRDGPGQRLDDRVGVLAMANQHVHGIGPVFLRCGTVKGLDSGVDEPLTARDGDLDGVRRDVA